MRENIKNISLILAIVIAGVSLPTSIVSIIDKPNKLTTVNNYYNNTVNEQYNTTIIEQYNNTIIEQYNTTIINNNTIIYNNTIINNNTITEPEPYYIQELLNIEDFYSIFF